MSPRLPDFLVVGAMRCGTTYLHHLLAQHPGVHVPPEKELHWFSRAMLSQGAGLDGYAELFAGAPDGALVGECTPDYVYHPDVAELLRRHLPDAKLVVVLRDPVARTLSHYWWAVSKGREHLPLLRALRAEEPRLRGGFWHRNTFSYVDKSRYDVQLARYLERFPREQVLVVLSEDLYARPLPTLRLVLAFLGADPEVRVSPDVERNAMPLPRWHALHRWCVRLQRRHLGPSAAPGVVGRWARRVDRGIPRVDARPPEPGEKARSALHGALHEHALRTADLLGFRPPWPSLEARS